MPYEGDGTRYSVNATKAAAHGDPVVENAHPGIAAKSTQPHPAYPTAANALAAQQIAVGEEMVIMLSGLHEVAVAKLPATAAVGADLTKSALYIRHADNALVLAATALAAGVLQAGFSRFGILSSIDTTLGRALVNLNLRGSF